MYDEKRVFSVKGCARGQSHDQPKVLRQREHCLNTVDVSTAHTIPSSRTCHGAPEHGRRDYPRSSPTGAALGRNIMRAIEQACGFEDIIRRVQHDEEEVKSCNCTSRVSRIGSEFRAEYSDHKKSLQFNTACDEIQSSRTFHICFSDMSQQVTCPSLIAWRGIFRETVRLTASRRHWRYISSFHGPWLQLPPEVLESLAYSNFYSPRPQPIDPAVFFDLVKIRRLVEDATNLAVRAANGTTSSSLSNSINASNGLLSGGSAAALGLGLGGGGNAKLSKERKHRMREHATQKLSHAYHLDEIAASVATMQSASALEDVAKFVLQRNENDADAKYVHFFHEKIPSRSLAECTSLEPLNDVISQTPTEGAPYRTRAVTRIFKEDFIGAAKDLTEALSVCRLHNAQHQVQNDQTELMTARDAAALPREYRPDAKVEEKDQPSSLECQLLFHRAGTYLTLACDHIAPALHGMASASEVPAAILDGDEGQSPKLAPAEKEAHYAALEARKLVRTYAKRALRDYISFLSHFDYTPGLPAEITEAFLQKVTTAANGYNKRARSDRLLDIADQGYRCRNSSNSLALQSGGGDEDEPSKDNPNGSTEPPPSLPASRVHPLNTLFAAVPPADLPPYPNESTALITAKDSQSAQTPKHPDISEAITYHPLLTDALHSLLLCHCLIQTSPKEHLRHAYMVARLARVCDGYPIFLAARSPARADWIEVVRRANNWLALGASWEVLCEPAPLPGQKEKKPETAEERRERSKREAIRDALADDRVHDEESFRASVRAREMRAAREEEEEQRREYLRTKPHVVDAESAGASENEDGSSPKRWAQGDGKEYPISTERADAIARWIREAPAPGGSGEGRSKKSGKRARLRREASDLSSLNGLDKSVDSLTIDE